MSLSYPSLSLFIHQTKHTKLLLTHRWHEVVVRWPSIVVAAPAAVLA
jgi:hypothetical protein